MKIGELSDRTGIPTRMLRYYEQQGLLDSERTPNGYRAYGPDSVEAARRVRGLIQAGLTTRMARVVLDIELACATDAPASCSRSLAEELAGELEALDERISCLIRSRDAVAEYLGRTQHRDLLVKPGVR